MSRVDSQGALHSTQGNTQTEVELRNLGDGGVVAEDESHYPAPTVKALLTFGLCLASFTTALDNTIIGK